MDNRDDPTTRFYADNASAYAGHSSDAGKDRLERFRAQLPVDADILELGCGGGRDSAWMLERGLRVTPTDGTPEMAAEASRRLGFDIGVLRFEDINMVDAYGGVWANACLLHVPRAKLFGILQRIHMALRTGGVFYASLKAGKAEGHDGLGRYYNYPSRDWLSGVYQGLPWSSVEIEESIGGAYDMQPTDWLHVTAVKQ
jgi:SAM-dependent methyltransferase